MTKEDNIIVPRWFLENVENTLRIQNNINLDKNTGETCQDRNVRESLNGLRKLLKGEELTGMERLEKLQPSLPSNMDEAANEYFLNTYGIDNIAISEDIKRAVKFGAKRMAEQGISLIITDDTKWAEVDSFVHKNVTGESVIQIRKEE